MTLYNAKTEAFADRFPAQWQWIRDNAPSFSFAESMLAAVSRWGGLTVKQFEAVTRCAEKAAKPKPLATELDASQIAQAFANAMANGAKQKSLKLRFSGFTCSPAPEHGKNPGAIYVKAAPGSEYLGKIAAGMFHPSKDCPAETLSNIVATLANPLEAAKAYGFANKRCSCCGKELSDPESEALGIGPICKVKLGF